MRIQHKNLLQIAYYIYSLFDFRWKFNKVVFCMILLCNFRGGSQTEESSPSKIPKTLQTHIGQSEEVIRTVSIHSKISWVDAVSTKWKKLWKWFFWFIYISWKVDWKSCFYFIYFFMKSLQQFFCTVMLSNFSGVANWGISTTQNAQNIANAYLQGKQKLLWNWKSCFYFIYFVMKSLQQFFCTVMLNNFSGVANWGISTT